MSVKEFTLVLEKIKPFTNYIYLHVLGEPLLHPQFEEIIKAATNSGFNINITTNGALLELKANLLLNNPIRQINISLHDAEENVLPDNLPNYLNSVLDFAVKASPNTYICLRLWNSGSTTSLHFNKICLNFIASRFNIDPDSLTSNTPGNGFKLAEHVFLQSGSRFEWPDEHQTGIQTEKNCYALRDHIAILSDGSIIPCCLDANANILLGNIFTDNLGDVLLTQRATEIKKGFEQRKVVEPLCATCGFIND